MNKRTASKLQSVTEFWNEWQLRLFVSSSLFLQIMLGVLGSRRKYTSRNWLRYILWLAYSPAYRIAAVSIAIISNDLGYCDNPSQQIRAFWAPFLLLHLGGPDTITAYSSEDNALCERYFLGLFTHFVGAVYIFLGSWKATPLNILAILMFKAGLIKYLDRTLYLMSRSNARFTKFVIRWLRDKGDKGDGGDDGGSHDDGGGSDEDDDGDEEPGDATFMGGYYFKKAEGCHVSCQPEIKKPEVVIRPCPAPRNKSIPEAAILRKADKFFPKFKTLFANLGLESTVLRKSKSFFQNLSWTEAFGVTEIELGFVYDIFYTNAADNKRGVLSRFICLCLTISTFMGFSIIDKHEYPTIDVIITWLLLVGAFLLEFYSIILLCSSDQTRSWLSKQEKTRVNLLCQAISSCRVTFLFPENNRWSNSMAQYILISYSLKNLNKFSEVWKFFSICPELEERSSKNSNVVPKYLKTLIFEQLQEKSRWASGIKAAKKLCPLKGEWALEKMKCFCRLSWSIGEEFDENILLWHVATEICYYTDLNKNSIPVKNPNREASKLLSDYLLHLLVKRPHMLPNGIGQIRFQDSSADATDFFRSGKHIKDRIQACEKLLQVNTVGWLSLYNPWRRKRNGNVKRNGR